MSIPDYRNCPGSSILSQCADAYVGYLQQQQYRSTVIRVYLRSVEHFASWVARQRVPLRSIDESLTRRFVTEHLPACRCPDPCLRTVITVRAALARLLHVLRMEGYLPEREAMIPPAIRDELERFDAYLDSVRGLTPATRASRRQWVSRFLTDFFALAPIDIGRIQPHDMVEFMVRPTNHYRPGTLGVLGCTLRSYLRFRAVSCGDRVESLLAAVPCIARWALDTVPRHLTAEEVGRFLSAFDQGSANGQRDYAMARCLLDIGLRAGEVAAIQLDDLNWREGTLTIRHGKSRRADVLPLPVSTGRAIVRYVCGARPPSSSRALFVRHRAPRGFPVTARFVSVVIRRAFERCGITRHTGTHVLRHTAAVRMRCAGASLKEIADVASSQYRHHGDLQQGGSAEAGDSGCALAGRAVMKRTPTMVSLVEDYLKVRRQMGFALGIAGDRLLTFARFADQAGHRGPVTFDLAVRWAQASPCHSRLTSAWRLQILRPFVRYRSQFDAGTAIVLRGFFGSTHRRLVPHIYTEQEIAALLQATDDLVPTNGLRPATYRTLFGLLAATGLRISEALHLQPRDVDLVKGLLMVRQTKFRKSRLVPLHPTAVVALKHYADARQRKLGEQKLEAFFVSDCGKPLPHYTVHNTFVCLRRRLAWTGRGGYALPRIHDLRHTFICRRLLDSYHRNQPPDHIADTLSTYVGHAKVSDTYWYVSATPELMASAAQRFALFVEGGRI